MGKHTQGKTFLTKRIFFVLILLWGGIFGYLQYFGLADAAYRGEIISADTKPTASCGSPCHINYNILQNTFSPLNSNDRWEINKFRYSPGGVLGNISCNCPTGTVRDRNKKECVDGQSNLCNNDFIYACNNSQVLNKGKESGFVWGTKSIRNCENWIKNVTCSHVKCDAKYEYNGSECKKCDTWKRSPIGNDSCSNCRSITNATFTSNGSAANNCDFSCNASYKPNNRSCVACPTWQYSQKGRSSCSNCTNKPNFSHYTSNGDSANGCTRACDTWYTLHNNSCVRYYTGKRECKKNTTNPYCSGTYKTCNHSHCIYDSATNICRDKSITVWWTVDSGWTVVSGWYQPCPSNISPTSTDCGSISSLGQSYCKGLGCSRTPQNITYEVKCSNNDCDPNLLDLAKLNCNSQWYKPQGNSFKIYTCGKHGRDSGQTPPSNFVNSAYPDSCDWATLSSTVCERNAPNIKCIPTNMASVDGACHVFCKTR